MPGVRLPTDYEATAIDLALRVGEVVLSSGAGAADTTANMLAVTSAAGMRNCDIDLTFTSITVAYAPRTDAPPRTYVRMVRYRGLDYSRLTRVDQLVHQMSRGELDVYGARKELAVITSAKTPYPRWVSTAALGVMAAGTGVMLGTGWWGAAVAMAAALLIGAVNRQAEKHRLPAFYQQVFGGFIAAGSAVFAVAVGPQVKPSLIVAAGVIVLLAGIALMGAIQDALTGYYVTASARSFEAVLQTGGIIGGISGGLALAGGLGIELTVEAPSTPGVSHLPSALIGAAVATAAFALSCYAPWRALVAAAVLGAIGQVVYRSFISADFGVAWSSAMAAVAIGAVSYAVAGRFRVPPLIVVVAGIVPLLPGLAIFRGLFQLLDAKYTGVNSMVSAVAIAVALAAGVILGEYIAQPLKREARRLETRLAGPRLVGPIRPRPGHRPRQRSRNRTGRNRR